MKNLKEIIGTGLILFGGLAGGCVSNDLTINPDEKRTLTERSRETLGLPGAFFCKFYNSQESWKTAYKEPGGFFREEENIKAVAIWEVVDADLYGKNITLDILGIDTNKIVRNYRSLRVFGFNADKIADNYGMLRENPCRLARSPQAGDLLFGSGDLWATIYDLSATELKELVGGNKFKVVWNLDGEPKKYADLMIVDAPKKAYKIEGVKK